MDLELDMSCADDKLVSKFLNQSLQKVGLLATTPRFQSTALESEKPESEAAPSTSDSAFGGKKPKPFCPQDVLIQFQVSEALQQFKAKPDPWLLFNQNFEKMLLVPGVF